MVGYYFSDIGTDMDKPKIRTSMSLIEWKFFIHQFATRVSSGSPYRKGTPIINLVKMLKEVFPRLFTGKASSYQGNITRQVEGCVSDVKQMLDFSENKDLRQKFKY